MKIICALGGGGSTFLLRALERCNYRRLAGALDPYPTKLRLERWPDLIGAYNSALRLLGAYRPALRVLMRPDSFWTDWRHHRSGVYDPQAPDFAAHLRGQAEYIVRTRRLRSAGLRISFPARHAPRTLAELVGRYLSQLRAAERTGGPQVVLLAGHWAEYGVFRELDLPAVYVIRDPLNSLISHSKAARHRRDYLRRGLGQINSRGWIDAYLSGPHHYWIRFARTALEHQKAAIVRYHRFAEDWPKLPGLPDISGRFRYRENDVGRVLSRESIEYVWAATRQICAALGFDRICARYLRR